MTILYLAPKQNQQIASRLSVVLENILPGLIGVQEVVVVRNIFDIGVDLLTGPRQRRRDAPDRADRFHLMVRPAFVATDVVTFYGVAVRHLLSHHIRFGNVQRLLDRVAAADLRTQEAQDNRRHSDLVVGSAKPKVAAAVS